MLLIYRNKHILVLSQSMLPSFSNLPGLTFLFSFPTSIRGPDTVTYR
ncbi:hypothetical protein ACHAXS_007947 [Conticribra weissflogii]